MGMLRRKTLRDLWSLRTQVLAIAAVTACGIGTFIMSASTVLSLEQTRTQYYRKSEFADLFCQLKRAPDSIAERLLEIEGVKQWETRVVTSARLTFPGRRESAESQIISIPDGSQSRLNRLHLRSGRLPSDDSDNEVVASEAFTIANRIAIGDSVEAVIYGRKRLLQVVGIGLSPEYIYEIAPGGLFPDNRSFGVLWMNRTALAGATGLTGAFNDLAVIQSPGSQSKEILRRIDELFANYGGLGAYARKDQRSHRFVSSEMDELKSMGIAAPTIFLCVASFLLNMVLSRLISTQREQVAALKAFGFSNWEIALHYMSMAWFISIVGAVCGTLVGAYLGHNLTQLYSRFFHFPSFSFSIPSTVLVNAWAISLLAATVGVWTSVAKVTRLQPAEAMLPEAAQRYRKHWTDSFSEILWLGTSVRMITRHLWRRPRRAILSVLGISLAVAVLILGSFMQDAVFSMFDSLFRLSRRYDLQVNLREPTHESIRFELQAIEGVLDCELYRSVPTRLTFDQRERLVPIIGMDPGSRLSCLIDAQQNRNELPASGILISKKLAEVVGAQIGDQLHFEVLEEDRRELRLIITATIDDLAGESVYINRQELSRLLQEPPRVSGSYLRIDSDRSDSILDSLRERPGISFVNITENLRRSFRETIAENVRRMRTMNMTFSLIIAIGVIYSTAKISLAERSRDFATLRVLGFSKTEVANFLFGELIFLTLLAIPVGWLIGYGLSYLTVYMFDRELFRMPLVVRFHTYAYATAIVIGATLAASWLVRSDLRKLSVIEVLKVRG